MTRQTFGLGFAAMIAILGIGTLAIELQHSLAYSFAHNRSLAEALFLHFRFFTILANWGIAALMVATLVQAHRRRPPPRASLHSAALVYILVVGTTYEALLRHTGMRHDLFFFTDMVMHDIVPAFYLAFWLGFAPKRPLDWRHPLLWLAFPLAYLGVTLVAGAMGEGYPYFFIDVTTIGARGVAISIVGFLLMFYLLGVGTVMLARAILLRKAG